MSLLYTEQLFQVCYTEFVFVCVKDQNSIFFFWSAYFFFSKHRQKLLALLIYTNMKKYLKNLF